MLLHFPLPSPHSHQLFGFECRRAGNQKRFCKDCSGITVCDHGRRKNLCKDCGSSLMCEHGKQRFYCKDCGGAGICEHGNRITSCKDCGTACAPITNAAPVQRRSLICEHGKRRWVCKYCGGKGICGHGRVRTSCKFCKVSRAALGAVAVDEKGESVAQGNTGDGGDSRAGDDNPKKRIRKLCEHNRRPYVCVACEGIAICVHKLTRYNF